VPADRLREKPPEGAVTAAVRRVLGGGEEKIKVRGGFDELLVVRARCCNPIRGEKIVGYITRGKGVSVHSATCPNVVNLMYDPERRIDVEWDKGDAVASYTVKLTMEVEDRKGLLAAVSAKIADINTNIKNMDARTAATISGRASTSPWRSATQAPREGDQIAPQCRWRLRRGEGWGPGGAGGQRADVAFQGLEVRGSRGSKGSKVREVCG
jgi:hypothetical protein